MSQSAVITVALKSLSINSNLWVISELVFADCLYSVQRTLKFKYFSAFFLCQVIWGCVLHIVRYYTDSAFCYVTTKSTDTLFWLAMNLLNLNYKVFLPCFTPAWMGCASDAEVGEESGPCL